MIKGIYDVIDKEFDKIPTPYQKKKKMAKVISEKFDLIRILHFENQLLGSGTSIPESVFIDVLGKELYDDLVKYNKQAGTKMAGGPAPVGLPDPIPLIVPQGIEMASLDSLKSKARELEEKYKKLVRYTKESDIKIEQGDVERFLDEKEQERYQYLEDGGDELVEIKEFEPGDNKRANEKELDELKRKIIRMKKKQQSLGLTQAEMNQYDKLLEGYLTDGLSFNEQVQLQQIQKKIEERLGVDSEEYKQFEDEYTEALMGKVIDEEPEELKKIQEKVKKKITKGGRPKKGEKFISSAVIRQVVKQLLIQTRSVIQVGKGGQDLVNKVLTQNPDLWVKILAQIELITKDENIHDEMMRAKGTRAGVLPIVDKIMDSTNREQIIKLNNLIIEEVIKKAKELGLDEKKIEELRKAIAKDEEIKSPEEEGIMSEAVFRPLVRSIVENLTKMGMRTEMADSLAIKLINSFTGEQTLKNIRDFGDIKEGVNQTIGDLLDEFNEVLIDARTRQLQGFNLTNWIRIMPSLISSWQTASARASTSSRVQTFRNLLKTLRNGLNEREIVQRDIPEDFVPIEEIKERLEEINDQVLYRGRGFTLSGVPLREVAEEELKEVQLNRQAPEASDIGIEINLDGRRRAVRLRDFIEAHKVLGLPFLQYLNYIIDMYKRLQRQQPIDPVPDSPDGPAPDGPDTPDKPHPPDDPNSFVSDPTEPEDILSSTVDPSEAELFVSTEGQVKEEQEDAKVFSIVPPVNGGMYQNSLEMHNFIDKTMRFQDTYSNPKYTRKSKRIIPVKQAQPILRNIRHRPLVNKQQKFQETVVQPSRFTRTMPKNNYRDDVYRPDSVYFPDIGLYTLHTGKPVAIPDVNKNDGMMRFVEQDNPKYEGGYEGQRDVKQSMYKAKYDWRTDRLSAGRNR